MKPSKSTKSNAHICIRKWDYDFKTDSQGKIHQSGNLKNDGNLEICRRYTNMYYVIFLAAQIHFKGVKLAPENPSIF